MSGYTRHNCDVIMLSIQSHAHTEDVTQLDGLMKEDNSIVLIFYTSIFFKYLIVALIFAENVLVKIDSWAFSHNENPLGERNTLDPSDRLCYLEWDFLHRGEASLSRASLSPRLMFTQCCYMVYMLNKISSHNSIRVIFLLILVMQTLIQKRSSRPPSYFLSPGGL